jgi:hypothetical protein
LVEWLVGFSYRAFVNNLKESSAVPQLQGKYSCDQAQRDEVVDHKRKIAY